VRILVTGGCGFIGSQVVDQLLDADHEVVVVDRVPPTDDEPADPRLDRRMHPVGDLDRMLDAVRGCEAVCHQAAKVGLGVDFSDAVDYVEHNDLARRRSFAPSTRRAFAVGTSSRAAW
jgi:dTDP-L-rhamnose 4-epimerase